MAPSAFCSQDYLAVYDGPDASAPLLGRFCGSTRPPGLRSSGSTVLLEFHTDAFQAARGWKLTFRQSLGKDAGPVGAFRGVSTAAFGLSVRGAWHLQR